MKRERPDWATVFRYALLQVPGTILVLVATILLLKHTTWSAWIVWAGFGAWVLKDTILFFWVWPSYRSSEGSDLMEGRKGRVVRSCRPEGTVEIYGALWKAVADDREQPLSAGTVIRVCGRDRLTLVVKAASREE